MQCNAASLMSHRFADTLKIQIMACTDDEVEMAWLNLLDCELPGVDVTDDYYAELQEVMRAGRVRKFTRGDWCLKAMLGPVLRRFDNLDEPTPFPMLATISE